MTVQSDRTTIVAAGLPNSGKTTYLGALAYLVGAGEVETAMTLAGYQPNEVYLNLVKESWLSFTPVAHNPRGSPEIVKLSLNLAGVPYQLIFPDIAGEVVEDAWTKRRWQSDFDEIVSA